MYIKIVVPVINFLPDTGYKVTTFAASPYNDRMHCALCAISVVIFTAYNVNVVPNLQTED